MVKKTKTGGGRRDRAFDAEVGARIRARRQKKKLTQLDLARMIDVSEGTVGRYEVGFSSCEPATLAVIAKALGCKPGVFLDGIDVRHGP